MDTVPQKAVLTSKEKRVIQVLQDGIPSAERPFQILAERAGLSEEEFLACVRNLCKEGYIRRFGATLQHQISGYAANAMIAWHADDEKIENAGRIMASFKKVTHCYQRRTIPGWPYNIYTMVHGQTEAECHAVARELAEKTGITDYQILFSEKELKRSNITYFREEQV
ncbi:MAG: Lrp/AsnC family transcriptional regulator [Thermodesulfobacteriota bacterium]